MTQPWGVTQTPSPCPRPSRMITSFINHELSRAAKYIPLNQSRNAVYGGPGPCQDGEKGISQPA